MLLLIADIQNCDIIVQEETWSPHGIGESNLVWWLGSIGVKTQNKKNNDIIYKMIGIIYCYSTTVTIILYAMHI
jgi:hypothetical protein